VTVGLAAFGVSHARKTRSSENRIATEYTCGMTDEEKKENDPVEDLRAGLGLLFRAARGAVEKIPSHKIEELVKEGTDKVGKAFHKVPTEKVEEVVKESAVEIGHAFAHVAQVISKNLEKKDDKEE